MGYFLPRRQRPFCPHSIPALKVADSLMTKVRVETPIFVRHRCGGERSSGIYLSVPACEGDLIICRIETQRPNHLISVFFSMIRLMNPEYTVPDIC